MYQPLTLEQFQKAKQAGYTPDKILSMEQKRKAQESVASPVVSEEQPQQESGGVGGFFKSLVSPVATTIARPFQAGAELLGASSESVDKFSNKYSGGLVAPVPKNFGDVKKDVGRGIQTAAFGLTGLASGGAAFGLGAGLEQGQDLFSKETALSTGGGAVAGKLLGFVGKPLINASGKVIGKITPQIVKDVSAKGANEVAQFMARHEILPKGVSKAINVGAEKAETIANYPFKATKLLLPKPKNIMNRVARLTPNEAAKFEKMTGISHGEYLTKTGNFGKPEDIVNKEFTKFTASKQSADDAFSQIKGYFREPQVETALRDLVNREINIGVEGGDSVVIKDLARKYQERGLDMKEINQVKRLFEKQKMGYFRENNSDKIERAMRIDGVLRKWQFKEADLRGFKNVADINKQTQASKFIIDKLGKQLVGKSGNNLIPLSDLVILSGGNIQNIAGYIAKRSLGSKTFQAKLAKILNSSEVKPFISAKMEKSGILELKSPDIIELGGAKTPTTYEPPAKVIKNSNIPQLLLGSLKSNAQGIPIRLPRSIRETNLGLDEIKNMKSYSGLNQPISPQITKKAPTSNISPLLPQNKVKVKPKTPKLAVEAKKYKSAEEFVKAQPKLFHSGTANIKEVNLGKTKFDKTFYLSDDANYAKSFGGKNSTINEMVLDTKAKLIDLRKPTEQQIAEITQAIKQEVGKPAKYGESFSFYPYSTTDVINGIKAGKAHFSELPQIKQILKGLGYDGQITAEVPYAKNIGIWNKEVIKTKSQLTDIWKKANKKTLPKEKPLFISNNLEGSK